MRNDKGKIVILLYVMAAIVLFLYSYTQVDLSLTLSRISLWQTIQQWFQNIGYYQRPLSTMLYGSILAVYFILYGFSISLIHKKQLSLRSLWYIILLSGLILWFSYPALSYDLFNHMFTAKTILVYHKNPYGVTPLQFTGVEPWLSFLHWTHVVSVFSPLWILLTLPAYILGFGYFLLIMWNFKFILVASYIAAVWAISKILKPEGDVKQALGMAIFALNPLVIIESLVNAHNDMLMMALALLAIVLYKKGKRWSSWLVLSLSIATKIITASLIPSFIARWNRTIALAFMIIGLIAFLAVARREIMPWYFLWIIPFIAILPDQFWLLIIGSGISLGLLGRYAPFLFMGDWNPPVPSIEAWATWVPIVISVGIVIFTRRLHKA
jgi:hypothetical protein